MSKYLKTKSLRSSYVKSTGLSASADFTPVLAKTKSDHSVKPVAAESGEYTNSDLDLFGELMNFGQSTSQKSSVKRKKTTSASVQYSDDDLRLFNNLIPDAESPSRSDDSQVGDLVSQ